MPLPVPSQRNVLRRPLPARFYGVYLCCLKNDFGTIFYFLHMPLECALCVLAWMFQHTGSERESSDRHHSKHHPHSRSPDVSPGFLYSWEFAAEPADIDASCSHLDLSGNKLSGALPAATSVGAQLRLEFITSSYFAL